MADMTKHSAGSQPEAAKSLPYSWANDSLKLWMRTYDMEKRLAKAIARNIRTKRIEAGLTQTELAVIVKKKQPQIARLERSTYGRHTIHSLNKLAVALGTTVSDLVSLDSEANTDVTNPQSNATRKEWQNHGE